MSQSLLVAPAARALESRQRTDTDPAEIIAAVMRHRYVSLVYRVGSGRLLPAEGYSDVRLPEREAGQHLLREDAPGRVVNQIDVVVACASVVPDVAAETPGSTE